MTPNSASVGRTSFSRDSPKASAQTPRTLQSFPNDITHTPHISKLPSSQVSRVEPLNIEVEDGPDGFVSGFLHLPVDFTKGSTMSPNQTAAILLSGAGGGVVGPSSIYLSIADKLAGLKKGIPCLRLDYRYPARNKYCVRDVFGAMDILQNVYGLNKFVLVGWSFGGAPVFTAGGADQRVVGCATVASQTAETDGIRRLSPRPVLLLHGTADRVLTPSCSEKLYSMYGSKGERRIELFEEDDHSLTRSAEKAERLLCDFITACAGLTVDAVEEKEIISGQLLGKEERVENMKKGGDLFGAEELR